MNKITRGKGDIEKLEKETNFNRLNYALKESSSSFITKKIYGLDSDNFFNFDENGNCVVNAIFGHSNEILSKFMIGLNFDKIEDDLNISNIRDLRFTFDYSKLKEYKNKIKIHVYSDYLAPS